MKYKLLILSFIIIGLISLIACTKDSKDDSPEKGESKKDVGCSVKIADIEEKVKEEDDEPDYEYQELIFNPKDLDVITNEEDEQILFSYHISDDSVVPYLYEIELTIFEVYYDKNYGNNYIKLEKHPYIFVSNEGLFEGSDKLYNYLNIRFENPLGNYKIIMETKRESDNVIFRKVYKFSMVESN